MSTIMVKEIIPITLALLAGCSNSSDEIITNKYEKDMMNEEKAEKTANLNLNKLRYPPCNSIWKDKKPTSCAKKIFEISLSICRDRALTWSQGGPLLDEYAGDSWIAAAGRSAVQSDDARLAEMEYLGDPSEIEPVAVLKGNGSADIALYVCELDRFKLKRIGLLGIKSH